VHATRAAWLDGAEVTEVWFDPVRLPFGELLAHGLARDCARRAWVGPEHLAAAKKQLADRALPIDRTAPTPDQQPKYYLLRTPMRFVPMTATQATRINAELAPGREGDAARWLSPRQRALLEWAKNSKGDGWQVAIDVPIGAAMAKLPR
jgi:hypothetical protein